MKKKILIVASNFYKKITENLVLDSQKELIKNNYLVTVKIVPGTFEVPVVISKNINKYVGFIALGCVIKGQTPHFDYLCSSTFNALQILSINNKKPIGNGIITCLNQKQAKIRSKLKGKESAIAVLKVLK
jgi:6,7-dimethyl-8-ribityllumazine synthase